MFGFGRKKVRSGPLWPFLERVTPEQLAAHLERESKEAESASDFLNQLILMATYSCAGHFLRGTGRLICGRLGRIEPDTLALETLAFCTYAIRECHLPMPDDPLDDGDPEALVEAYRWSIGVIPFHVEKVTSWEIGDLWNRRIMFYFQRENMKDAAEAFAGLVFTMSDAKLPAVSYGPLSLDFELNTTMRAGIYAFASTMPKGTAEVIQNVVAEYGLAD